MQVVDDPKQEMQRRKAANVRDGIADGALQKVAWPRRDVESAAAPLPESRCELRHMCLAGRQVRKSDEAIHQAVPQSARTGLMLGMVAQQRRPFEPEACRPQQLGSIVLG